MDFGLSRKPTKRSVKLTVHSCAARLAFSHLPLHRLIKAQVPILAKAYMLPPRNTPRSTRDGDENVSVPTPFRESHNAVAVSVQDAGVWLCSDGPASFGTPDVLQVRFA